MPAVANPMIYLPTRVTPEQHARLVALRDLTGVTISEHVRFALDPYLARVEKKSRVAALPEAVNGVGGAAPAKANAAPSPPKPRPAAAPPPRIAAAPTVRRR